MLIDVTDVTPLDEFRLHLRFEDGTAGEIDLGSILRFDGVFAPLKDRSEFVAVRVDPELGTIVWPCGADLDPDVLYSMVSGQPLPSSYRRE